MKISELWLKEWIDFDLDSIDLIEQINNIGIEVKNIEPAISKNFRGIFIGEIISCQKHKELKNTKIVTVSIGKKNTIDIISKFKDCCIGLRVAVSITKGFFSCNSPIKSQKIGNQTSEGALCSFLDLGISTGDEHEIAKLPYDAPIGSNLEKFLKPNDRIISISESNNRPDLFSLLGIAREISIQNRSKLNFPTIQPVSDTVDEIKPAYVLDQIACPMYMNRSILDINLNVKTPFWIKEKLRRCGIHSKNIVLDIASYVCLEFGQPIQILDQDKIEGDIIIRWSKENEFIEFYDKRINLKKSTLLIADSKKVLSIAGVLKGSDSDINSSTKNIVLECAYFHPRFLIGKAKRYGIFTDFSMRNERGLNPFLFSKTIERITSILMKICGGRPGPILTIKEKSFPLKRRIFLHKRKIYRLIGYEMPKKKIVCILNLLGFRLIPIGESWKVLVPNWRSDILIEENIIAEIIRIYGYDSIPNKSLHARNHRFMYLKDSKLSLSRVKERLTNLGYQEVITYSFVCPKIQKLFFPNDMPITILNPISKNLSTMRLSLWIGIVKTMIHNQNYQQRRIRLFESGLCFIPDESDRLGVRQKFMISGAISGLKHEIHWDMSNRMIDFYDIKGDVESLIDLTGKLEQIEFKKGNHPSFHPGQSACIYLKEELIGWIGAIHPRIEKKLDLMNQTFLFELFWEKISNRNPTRIRDISHFPLVRRDLSIIVEESINVSDIIKECKRSIKDRLVDIRLFDVYRGGNIKKGFKSLSINLNLQDTIKTLEEREISLILLKCVQSLKEKFNISIREK